MTKLRPGSSRGRFRPPESENPQVTKLANTAQEDHHEGAAQWPLIRCKCNGGGPHAGAALFAEATARSPRALTLPTSRTGGLAACADDGLQNPPLPSDTSVATPRFGLRERASTLLGERSGLARPFVF